ncbi:MAG TPA: hypothetical protein VL329_00305 [Nitrospiraceae bacterium]|nr:hypothetical protein [Nitrospiraceae bacterium]
MKTRMYRAPVAVLCSVLVTGIRVTMAEVRVEDLPKPIPQVIDKVKEVGNEVGKGISDAASTATGAVNKAVKGENSENQTSKKSAK